MTWSVGSQNKILLLSITSWDLTLFPINFWFMAAIFEFQHTQTSNSVLTNLLCCLTPKTRLLSLEFRCHHEYELRYTLFPIYFRSITAILSSNIPSQTVFSLMSLYCLTLKTWVIGYSRWNSFAIYYTSWDIRYFQSTSVKWPLIFNIPWRRAVFPLVFLCCLTPKYWV